MQTDILTVILYKDRKQISWSHQMSIKITHILVSNRFTFNIAIFVKMPGPGKDPAFVHTFVVGRGPPEIRLISVISYNDEVLHYKTNQFEHHSFI